MKYELTLKISIPETELLAARMAGVTLPIPSNVAMQVQQDFLDGVGVECKVELVNVDIEG